MIVIQVGKEQLSGKVCFSPSSENKMHIFNVPE